MIDEPETKIMNKLEKEGYKFTKKRISSQTESFEYKNGSFITKSNKATSRIRFEIIDPKGQKIKNLDEEQLVETLHLNELLEMI